MNAGIPLHIVTASLVPGDAIGNYVLTLRQILADLGFSVQIYADYVAPEYGALARFSDSYRPENAILWFHYSIYADNFRLIDAPAAFRIMDFHGVSPPSLFAGYEPYLANLCDRGLEALAGFRDAFDLCVVHSDFSRDELVARGYRRPIITLPLVVDETRFDGGEDSALSRLLVQMDYLLFVGRIVPQKDILALLHIFYHLRSLRLPGHDTGLVLVGSRNLAPGYQREIDSVVERLGLGGCVLFAGQIAEPAMLAAFFRHAAFTLITSEWETFCVPMIESIALGTPVVAHNIPPIPEVLDGAGLLIDKRDPSAAASTVLELWQDRDAYERLVQVGRARARHFTGRMLRRQVLQMLNQVFDHAA